MRGRGGKRRAELSGPSARTTTAIPRLESWRPYWAGVSSEMATVRRGCPAGGVDDGDPGSDRVVVTDRDRLPGDGHGDPRDPRPAGEHPGAAAQLRGPGCDRGPARRCRRRGSPGCSRSRRRSRRSRRSRRRAHRPCRPGSRRSGGRRGNPTAAIGMTTMRTKKVVSRARKLMGPFVFLIGVRFAGPERPVIEQRISPSAGFRSKLHASCAAQCRRSGL